MERYNSIMSWWLTGLMLFGITAFGAPPQKQDEKKQPAKQEQAKPEQAKPQEEPPPPDEDAAANAKVYSFNPLQAQKEMRTGEFYFKKGSYRAAATRFREATKWNPTY